MPTFHFNSDQGDEIDKRQKPAYWQGYIPFRGMPAFRITIGGLLEDAKSEKPRVVRVTSQEYKSCLFLCKYSPALIVFHLLGCSSLQHAVRGSMFVSASGKPKHAILYLSGSCPAVRCDGSATLWTAFFHRPLLQRMSRYPALTKIVSVPGSTSRNVAVFSTAAEEVS